eukprot:SAG31_NODE_9049_length_1343_cov_1.037781_1_plen_68_part_00
MRSLVEMMGGKIDDEALSSAMKEPDTSGDGKVSFAEFQTYWDANFASGGCGSSLSSVGWCSSASYRR